MQAAKYSGPEHVLKQGSTFIVVDRTVSHLAQYMFICKSSLPTLPAQGIGYQ